MPENAPELARKLSPRHFAVGADGLICICKSEVADAQMRMFNADGSESKMCGNGIRCVAQWLYEHGRAGETMTVDTLAGRKTIRRVAEGQWRGADGAGPGLARDLHFHGQPPLRERGGGCGRGGPARPGALL